MSDDGAVTDDGGTRPAEAADAGPTRSPLLLDVLCLVLVWCAPVTAVALKMTHAGLGVIALLLAVPVLLVATVHALSVFTAVLGPRSRLRARLGGVPARYRAAALGWVAALQLTGLAFPEWGVEQPEDASWASVSALEGLLGRAVPVWLAVVLVLAGLGAAAWLQISTDVERRRVAPVPRTGRRR